MKYIFKNYLFIILSLLIFLAHQIIFQDFFPNKNSLLGNDYSFFLPNFIFGKIWFNNNFLSIPWFSPSFCCGIPFFGDPQSMYYSLHQLFFIIFSPIVAIKLIFLLFSLVSFFGTFFLMHKSFKKNIYISLIAATLFLFNGFFNYRNIIGHLTYVNYIFIPLYCYLLITSFENKKNTLKCFFYNIVSGLVLTHIVLNSGGTIAFIIILSIIFVILIHIFLNEKFNIIYYLLSSFFIALLICSSKINASFSYLNNFPREYPPIMFENFIDLIVTIFKSLFLYADAAKFNSEVINKLPYTMKVIELEYGITLVPLFILAIFLYKLNKIHINKFTLKKTVALFVMIIILIFTISINISNSFGIFLSKLPVIKSSWVNIRYTAVYILPLIIISCLMIEKSILKENNIKIFTTLCLLVILIQNYNYKKNFYYDQKYNPANFKKLHNDEDGIKNLKVKNIALITDKNKNPVLTIQRNNLFIHELSPVLCYQTMFGYKSEFLPSKKLTFDKINKINDNLFYYTGNPKKIYNESLNFFNPSCFIFPKENNCIPGDMFKKTQINELENFLNYKSFKFKLSKLQKIFNYISLISLIFSICFITYCLIKKIISNKSSDEQNH